MKDTKNVSMPWGDVPIKMPKETINCEICGRKKVLTDDEKYICEICNQAMKPKKSPLHPQSDTERSLQHNG
jgi:hypothetical protein